MVNDKGYLQAVDNAAYQYFMISKKIVDTIDSDMSLEERFSAATKWQETASAETIGTLVQLEEIFKIIAKTYNKSEEEIGAIVSEKVMEYAINDILL